MQIRLQNGKKLQLSFRESEFIFTEQLKKFSEEASSIKNHNCIFKEDYKSAIKLCNGYVSLLKYYLTSEEYVDIVVKLKHTITLLKKYKSQSTSSKGGYYNV